MTGWVVSGQITIIPKPEIRECWGRLPLQTTMWGYLSWGRYNLAQVGFSTLHALKKNHEASWNHQTYELIPIYLGRISSPRYLNNQFSTWNHQTSPKPSKDHLQVLPPLLASFVPPHSALETNNHHGSPGQIGQEEKTSAWKKNNGRKLYACSELRKYSCRCVS